jgi:hypothetical protein
MNPKREKDNRAWQANSAAINFAGFVLAYAAT